MSAAGSTTAEPAKGSGPPGDGVSIPSEAPVLCDPDAASTAVGGGAGGDLLGSLATRPAIEDGMTPLVDRTASCASRERCIFPDGVCILDSDGKFAHTCRVCRSPCHATCGTLQGDEGYGAAVLCFRCELAEKSVPGERAALRRPPPTRLIRPLLVAPDNAIEDTGIDENESECEPAQSGGMKRKSRWFGLADILMLEGALAGQVYHREYGKLRKAWQTIAEDVVKELARKGIRTHFKVIVQWQSRTAAQRLSRACPLYRSSHPRARAKTATNTSSNGSARKMRKHCDGQERPKSTPRRSSS